MKDSGLELVGVEKTVDQQQHIYPTTIRFRAGSFTSLLGTTLAGKTTLMRLMAGLDRPTGGTVLFDGRDVTRVPIQKRNVSMVYQQFINYPNLNVFDNIASPLRAARTAESTIRQRVMAMAELLRIEHLLDRRPSELSGGQQQRTAMARALIKDSDLILLDEPLANLDFKLREELRDELPRLFRQRQCVVVYATTEPTEALLLGGDTVALDQGRVVDYGLASQIYREPDNLTAAQVFSDPPMNLARVRSRHKLVTFVDQRLAQYNWKAPTGLNDGDYQIGIRPHSVFSQKPSGKKQMLELSAKVKIAEISGSESVIHFSLNDNDESDDWVSLSSGVFDIASGQTIRLFVDTRQCLYFDREGNRVSLTDEHN